MNKNNFIVLIALCLFNFSFCDQFKRILDRPHSIEDRNKLITMLAYKMFRKTYEKGIIDHVLQEILNGPQIVEIGEQFLDQQLLDTQQKIDEQLFNHYNISKSEIEYMNKMKRDRDQYGMTYDSYKLLTE